MKIFLQHMEGAIMGFHSKVYQSVKNSWKIKIFNYDCKNHFWQLFTNLWGLMKLWAWYSGSLWYWPKSLAPRDADWDSCRNNRSKLLLQFDSFSLDKIEHWKRKLRMLFQQDGSLGPGRGPQLYKREYYNIYPNNSHTVQIECKFCSHIWVSGSMLR